MPRFKEERTMATSNKTFQQVKSILQRMDRKIDSARDMRLSGGIEDDTMIGGTRPEDELIGGQSEPISSAQADRPQRARPLARRATPKRFM